MQIGDIVMFSCEGTYAKWFFGQLAVVKNVSVVNDRNDPSKSSTHFRVEWLSPVRYFDKYATISDFSADKFTLFDKQPVGDMDQKDSG
tara:strand:+ start:493 stop:756 length:264 start_codon:yes stop_codon:yes gene_type:complete